jgi:regulator of replication initiation timing
MNEEEKTRAEEVQDLKENIEETLKETDQIKKIAQQNIEASKAMCVDMDKLQDTLGKEKIIADSMTVEVVDGMSGDEWSQMRNQFVQAANVHKGMSSLRRDMEGVGAHVQQFTVVTGTNVASNSTAILSGSHILMSHANQHPSVDIAFKTVTFTPTWIDDVAFIKAELKKIVPDVSKEFEGVIADMSGAGNAGLKYKALLALRSVLFDQLLDIIAPEAQYSQTSWYKRTPTTPAAAPFRKKRFCRPKFFIFRNNDETAFLQSMIDAVNKTSVEMAAHFHGMSKYGKEGASEILIDNCYRETLTSFANAIRLRNQFQKRP